MILSGFQGGPGEDAGTPAPDAPDPGGCENGLERLLDRADRALLESGPAEALRILEGWVEPAARGRVEPVSRTRFLLQRLLESQVRWEAARKDILAELSRLRKQKLYHNEGDPGCSWLSRRA
jgi:hypothetical protein